MKDITFHEFGAVITVPRASVECFYEDCERNSELVAAFQVRILCDDYKPNFRNQFIIFLQSETPGSIKSENLLRASIRFPNGSLAAEMDGPSKEGNFQLYCPGPGLTILFENTYSMCQQFYFYKSAGR